MIICNGFPKCGVHALSKACGLLSLPSQLGHFTWEERDKAFAGDKHVLIIRDPRNALISRLRMDGQQLTSGNIILRINEYETGDKGFVDAFSRYTAWLKNKNTHIVRFEDLIKDDTEIKALAKHLGTPYFADAFDNLEGFTKGS